MSQVHLHCQDSLEPWSRPQDWPLPQAVFTSPRYNKGLDYGLDAEGGKIEDSTDPADYYYHLLYAWRRAYEETAPDATLWVNTKPDDPFRDSQAHCAAFHAGWTLQTTFAWVYHVALPDGTSIGQFSAAPQADNPHSGFELVRLYRKNMVTPVKLARDAEGVGVPYSDKSNLTRFTASSGGQAKPDRRCRGNVWLVPYETKTRRVHPCPFPSGLPELALRLLALPPRSVVADPFCGVGSTGKAALALGLRFLGLDLSPTYIEEARASLEGSRYRRSLSALKEFVRR